MEETARWFFSMGLSFIIAAFLSAMTAFVIEKKGWF